MKESVIVSTGQAKLHLFYAARGAQKAGLLHSMITPVYLRDRWVPIIKRLQNITKNKFFKKLLSYNDDQIDEKKVVSCLSAELLSRFRMLVSRRGLSKRKRFILERVASLYYGKRANRHIDLGVKLIHSRSGYSRAIIPHAQKMGVKVLLEQSAAHPDFVTEILDEEYEKWSIPVKDRTYLSPKEEMVWDISQSKYILTNSDYIAQTIKKHTKDRKNIFTVHTGIDTNIFKPKEKPDLSKFRVLYVGNLSTFKGVGYLIKAFMKLRLPEAELVLVGPKYGDCPDIVEKCKEYFTYIPTVPYNEVPAIFASADAFVFAGLIEGPTRAIGEAMASGLPCIVTPSIPNCGHIVENGVSGFITPAKDIDALAEKMLYLYKNRDICFEMGRKGREKAVNSLTWRHFEKNVVEVYKQAIELQ